MQCTQNEEGENNYSWCLAHDQLVFECPGAPNLEKAQDQQPQGSLVTYDYYLNKLYPKDTSGDRDPELP